MAAASAQNERQRIQDLEDFNYELAGSETGRMLRFLSVEAREALAEAKGGRVSKSRLSALDWLLLSNPDYGQAYERSMDALVRAEEVVQTALEKAIAKAEETQRALDALMAQAMRLPDGRAVFMDRFGTVRDERGTAIDAALADALEWQGHEPGFEAFDVARSADEEANASVLRIREDQAELGDIRQELTDSDTPPSATRIEELTGRSNEIFELYNDESGLDLENDTVSFGKAKFEFPAR